MKYLVILVIVTVSAAGLWWLTAVDTGESSPTVNTKAAPESPSVETIEGSSLADSVQEESSVSDSATSDAVVDDEVAITGSGEAQASSDAPVSSPFDVVDGQADESTAASVDADIPIAAKTDSTAVAPVVNEGTRTLLEPVEVPDSYPVTDAAKYFIPKEERGPGRLGGPPPLDFPGGPSDPNGQSGESVFQPPAAPGQ